MASSTQGCLVKALIVEDVELQSRIISRILQMFQCETTVAKNGKEAVDLFREGKKFDIVLCDKEMPIMSGPEAVEKIRAMGETDIKIVGMSANHDAAQEFIGAGANDFEPKPLKVNVLKGMVQEVINKKNNSMV